MSLSAPYGGFLVIKRGGVRRNELSARLADNAQCVEFEQSGLFLASWRQFSGQGLWHEKDSAVAYDTDLTNYAQLCALVDLPNDSNADTGLLLWRLYKAFGDDLVDKLRGAFSFALWDGVKDKLLVITDYYGIRPVVFTGSGNDFSAASRIRQLDKPALEKEINLEAIYHYLFFQAICSPVSIYQGIRKLEPGKGLHLRQGKLSEFTWYDIGYRPDQSRSEEEWCKNISQEVETAVSHFVPVTDQNKTGCFLSGGTDSSTIAGYYTRLANKPAKTFSIGFDVAKYNELDFARIAARHFDTKQHEYLVTPADVLHLIQDLPKIYDEPFGNASVVAAYYCAQLAKDNGVEVLLGGDGGDEVFGGNERYVTNLLFQRYADLPALPRRVLFEPLLNLMPSIGFLYKAKRYVRRANILNPRRFYSYNLLAENDNFEIFQPEFLSSIDTECFFKHADTLYGKVAATDDTDRLLYLDMKNTITDNDLRKVTQMVEAAGLRVRYPLLDRDLVDFAATIPSQLKVKPGKNRYIFKQAMRGFLPDETIHKTKHGMGLPIAKWLKEDPCLNALLEETLFNGKPEIYQFVRPEYLHKLRNIFITEDTPYYGDSLWVFLMLEIWLKQHSSRVG